MELRDFLEKFLPDYCTKYQEYRYTISDRKRMPDGSKHSWLFAAHFFPEALDNYTARICEKQREKCFENFMVGDIALKTAILNTPQPNPNEL